MKNNIEPKKKNKKKIKKPSYVEDCFPKPIDRENMDNWWKGWD